MGTHLLPLASLWISLRKQSRSGQGQWPLQVTTSWSLAQFQG